MYVAYFLLLLLYIVKNCSRMLWMICNSNLRISISCNESSVSSAAAAAAAAVEDDVLPSSSHDVVSNEVRKLVYLLPIFDNDPRAATVPLPVRIRSLRVSLALEEDGGCNAVVCHVDYVDDGSSLYFRLINSYLAILN